MALILNIETTTTNCSVSIGDAGKLIGLKEDKNENYSHAESLHVFIQRLLEECKLKTFDLDAIAVSEGPGSYTGLRIGVSAAKGLCFALDIPLLAIKTLEALSHQAKVDAGFIIPMLDARRMEVYSAIYTSEHDEIEDVNPNIIDADSFKNQLEVSKTYFVGNTNAKVKEVITHSNATFLHYTLPSAKEMARLSFNKYQKGLFEDLAYFEPRYLKEFRAGKKG